MKRFVAGTGLLLAALLVGAAFHFAGRVSAPAPPAPAPPAITPGVLMATPFADGQGQPQSLAPYAGQVIVLNFWATWCAPCREEMPGFVRLQARWRESGVQFIGLANDDPVKVVAFGRELGVNYPLWVGGSEISDLSRRLGNRLGVLPYTVILGPTGDVLDQRMGLFHEHELDKRLGKLAAKSR